MGAHHDAIPDKLGTWIDEQHLFFVASAPRDGQHVNVSPKGTAGTFVRFDAHRVGYLDYHGSGAETIAHLREPDNARLTIMFCAFEKRPNIVRLFGRGGFAIAGTPEFASMRGRFPVDERPGERSIIWLDVDLVTESCGYAVPFMDYVADREVLAVSQKSKPVDEFPARFDGKNARSLDGLPALEGLSPV